MGYLSEGGGLDLAAYRQIMKIYMRYVLIISTKHADKKVRKIAKALNALDGFSRQVLVLHFIEDMSGSDIADLYPANSIDEIETAIILASKQLVEQLAELLPKETVLLFDDVGKWLSRLKSCLDLYVMETIGKAGLVYLKEQKNNKQSSQNPG